MRKVKVLLTGLITLFLLAACNLGGDSTEEDTRVGEELTKDFTTETKEDEEEFKADEESVPFIFTDFELDVAYAQDIEFEVEFQQEGEYIQAEYENEHKGEKLKGEAAYEKIRPILEKIEIDTTTDNEEALSQVIDAFDIPEDFNEIELKIEFEDGVIRKYEKK